MDTSAKRSMHPMMWVATGAVTLFSIVGIAALTGVLPARQAKPDLAPAASVVQTAPAASAPAPLAEASIAAATEPAPVASAPEVVKPATPARKSVAAHKPASSSRTATRHASNESGTAHLHPVAQADPAPRSEPPLRQPTAQRCEDCGVIESVRTVTEAGQGSGLGAVGGAVLGGVLGNQVGAGSGRTAARIGGAILGGFAGNEAEKRVRSGQHYVVSVRMDDGSHRSIVQKTAPTWVAGDKVRIEGETIVSRSGGDAS